ncbi:hypothetical protein E2C01_062898 [Portunus trituberculatus]|uniref:Uncharacterized protein n=1 Tax=Portunus trituberculatus TaxID=210409 RepID=A0A5B7HJD2_PORTR|nr:hypothetical protein [Portunus trituberculatus]
MHSNHKVCVRECVTCVLSPVSGVGGWSRCEPSADAVPITHRRRYSHPRSTLFSLLASTSSSSPIKSTAPLLPQVSPCLSRPASRDSRPPRCQALSAPKIISKQYKHHARGRKTSPPQW